MVHFGWYERATWTILHNEKSTNSQNIIQLSLYVGWGRIIGQKLFEIMLCLFLQQSMALAYAGWKTRVEQCTDIIRMEQLIAVE